MIRIERLRLSLPPGLEHRATHISRLVGYELSQRPVLESKHVERLEVPEVSVEPGLSDRQIARRIAGAISKQL